MGCVLQPAAPQELAEQVPEHGAPNQGEWMGEDAWGRPIAFHMPGPPAAIDLSKCEPRSNLWAQHCSAMGCPSWIWCSKTNERATCTHCGRPWIRSFIDIGPHFCGEWPPPADHHEQGGYDQAPDRPRAPGPKELVTMPWRRTMQYQYEWPHLYSDHCQRRQCLGK